MTVTIDNKLPRAQGISRDLDLSLVNITIDTETYTTGGISFDYKQYVRADGVVIIPPREGYVFEYDYSNKNIKVYYADYDASADGALVEYANSTTLTLSNPIDVIIIGTD